MIARETANVATSGLVTKSVQRFGANPPFALWFTYSVAIYKSFILPVVGKPSEFITVQLLLFVLERLKVRGVLNASNVSVRKDDQENTDDQEVRTSRQPISGLVHLLTHPPTTYPRIHFIRALIDSLPSGPASRHFHHFRYVQQYCGFLDHVQKCTDSCNARNIQYCFFSQDLRSLIPEHYSGIFDLRK